MSEYKILKKGIFDSARSDFPFADQYIIARKDDKKLLLVRIFNPLDKTIDGVKVSVKTFDKDGQVVSEDLFSYVLTCSGMSRAPLPQEIQIDEKVVSCEVEVKSVACNGDTLVVSGKRVRPIYDDAFSQKSDIASVASKEREQSTVVPKPGRLLLFVVACFMLVAMLVTIFAINGYVKTHDEFSISNVEYRFSNPDDKDGSIIVTGYTGVARNLVIPQEIDGHKIVAIDESAFANNGYMRSMTIDAEVSISKNAFQNCLVLEKISINNPLGIDEGAFSGCVNLKSVEINDSSKIERIFANTFKNCNSLKSFTIPQNVISIADNAFEGCYSLESVLLPGRLRTIGNYAFKNCTELKKIIIPQNVVNVGTNVFEGCINISDMTFSRVYGAAFYSLFGSESAVPASLSTITYKGDVVEPYMFSFLNDVKTVFLPNAKKIEYSAFHSCASLESVSLSKNLTSIAELAFAYCYSLGQISIPQSVSYIGERAFTNCYNLESVTLPYNVQSIEASTFSYCSNLSKLILPDSIRYIGDMAFDSCYGLKELTIPDGVESVGSYILSNCNSLEELTMPKLFGGFLASVFGGEYSSDYGCVPNSLKTVTIKGESIPDYAFTNLSGIKEIYLPDAISIGEYAFFQCSSLQSVELSPDILNIGRYAFENCFSLQAIVLPQGITRIEDGTFVNCTSLAYVDVASDLTYVGESAFASCENLASVYLGNVITDISSSAFSNCKSLTSVSIPSTVIRIGESAFANCAALSQVEFHEGLQEISANAFADCVSLHSLTIPTTVTNVYAGAFSNCRLEDLTMPQVFGNYMAFIFGGINGYTDNYMVPSTLVSVTITDSNVPEYAFSQCSNIQTVTIGNAAVVYDNAFSYCSSLTQVNLPETLTSIYNSAFAYCVALASVSMPNTVVTVGSCAFEGCTGLSQIRFSTSLTSIGEGAFSNCSSLESIRIPSSVTSLGYGAFSSCSGLKEINLPSAYGDSFSNLFGYSMPSELKKITFGSTTVPSNYFSSWSNVEEIVLENTTEIGSNAFNSCFSLKSITLPSTLTTINDWAFSFCSSLSSVVLPSSLSVIRAYAFYNCPSLMSIVLPSSLTTIESDAFLNCNKLYEIYNLSSLPLVKGSWEYGQVALKAKIIHTSLDEDSLSIINTQENIDLIKIGDEYLAVKYRGSNTELTLGELHYDGVNVSDYSIEKDFLNDSSVSSLTVGTQARLTAESFANCYNLTYVDLKDSMAFEIPDSCFNNCSSLTTVLLPTYMNRIGAYAFYSCNSLTNIDLPRGAGIGSYAFSSCYNLEKVVLPEGISIENDAFYECFNLFEVYNLSGLDLSDFYSTGYVSAYALKVYDSASAASQVTRFKDDQGFKYVLCDGQAHLYGFEGTGYPYYYINDTISYNGTSYPCSIRSRAFNSLPGGANLVVSKRIVFDDPNNKTFGNSPNVYYRGTQSDWEENVGSSAWGWNSLCYQANCVHDYGYWAEINGQIISNPSFESKVTKEATCTEEGEIENKCTYCGKKIYTTIPTTEHNYDDTVVIQATCNRDGTLKRTCSVCGYEIYETIPASNWKHVVSNGRCTVCGIAVREITEQNITDYFDIEVDPAYPFEWKDGVLVSSNKGYHGTRSSITLRAKNDYEIAILYSVSSENNCDNLIIQANGEETTRISGEKPDQTLSTSMLANYTLTFTYEKDGSVDSGDDVAKILKIYIYERS